MDTIKKLGCIFNRNEKFELLGLLIALIIGAFVEILGISLVVPFTSVVTNPQVIQQNKYLLWVYNFFMMDSYQSFLFLMCGAMLLVFVVKNIYLAAMYYAQYRFVYHHQAMFSEKMLRSYVEKPYMFHLQNNSSELTRNVIQEVTNLFSGLLIPVLGLASEAFVLLFITLLLLLVEPIVTLFAMIIIGGFTIAFTKIFQTRVRRSGEESQYYSGQMIKWVGQSLGGIKEIKVSQKENYFIDCFSVSATHYAKIQEFAQMLAQLPRYLVEVVVIFSLVSTVSLLLIKNTESSRVVSILALYVMAAFRLMPSAVRMNSYINRIIFHKPAIDVIYADSVLDRWNINDDFSTSSSIEVSQTFQLNHQLLVKDLSFSYGADEKMVLRQVNIQVDKGNAVALIGASGSGKTTLVDIILGVLEPDAGTVLVDGEDIRSNLSGWRQNVGYIPQVIYLVDDTIKKNIAFGVPEEEIDEQLVWQAVKLAQLFEFVKDKELGLDTYVGERGIQLSGGQRQRIGIARALYHNPEVLILDEATSALDNETEFEVMKAIQFLKGLKTIIIIAHRLSTIGYCDCVYELSSGAITPIVFRREEEH